MLPLYTDLVFWFGGGQGFPSLVKGARLRTLSRRRSWVQIPPPALLPLSNLNSKSMSGVDGDSMFDYIDIRIVAFITNLIISS